MVRVENQFIGDQKQDAMETTVVLGLQRGKFPCLKKKTRTFKFEGWRGGGGVLFHH